MKIVFENENSLNDYKGQVVNNYTEKVFKNLEKTEGFFQNEAFRELKRKTKLHLLKSPIFSINS